MPSATPRRRAKRAGSPPPRSPAPSRPSSCFTVLVAAPSRGHHRQFIHSSQFAPVLIGPPLLEAPLLEEFHRLAALGGLEEFGPRRFEPAEEPRQFQHRPLGRAGQPH